MPYTRAKGMQLHYQIHGREDAASGIVLIRGLGTQMIEWSSVLLEGLVSAGLRVVIFDNRDVLVGLAAAAAAYDEASG
jgi:pimeloyl-ACP methyl ester carboxylesterase